MEGEALIGLAGAGVVAALLQAVKSAIGFPTRFAPLVAVGLGIAWNVGLRGAGIADETYPVAVVLGVLSGLGASGLYSGAKAIRGG